MEEANNLRILDLFKRCDSKGTGLINEEDFSALCKNFGISESDSRVIFIDLDHNGDGEIDFCDFKYGFRDFLNPGSKRGSLQVSLNDGKTAIQQLMDMEKKHESARAAWKNFVENVGPSNVTQIIESDTENESSEKGESFMRMVKNYQRKNSECSIGLEKTLGSLMAEVQRLHDEYKTLENSFKKEKHAHTVQLAALGEELDSQLAKTEAKLRYEAKIEAKKQMDAERKKITFEVEAKIDDLTSQMKNFEKVEEWLLEEEAREKSLSSDETNKRSETENENRKLRSALIEAQMQTALLKSQLAQKRNEFLDLYQELHSEKIAASEYRNQCDMMKSHLSILNEANRVLSDSNDCYASTSYINNSGDGPENLAHALNRNRSSLHFSCSDLSSCSPELSKSRKLINILNGENKGSSLPSFYDSKNKRNVSISPLLPTSYENEKDRDSGHETLLEELRAESDSSPLPSGQWSSSENSPPLGTSPLPYIRKNSNYMRNIIAQESTNKHKNNEVNSSNYSSLKQFPTRTFKVILAGDASVGKTSFIERACHGHFVKHLSSTIGVDFRVKTLEVDGNCVALQLWDTAGQERFRSLTKSYFRRADGVILMYDVSNEQSFVSIRQWIQSVEESCVRKIPLVLCGNKVDLRDNVFGKSATTKKCVSYEDGLSLSRQVGSFFIEISPKSGYHVMEALLLLATEMSYLEDIELRSCVHLKELEVKTRNKSCCGTGNSRGDSTISSSASIKN